MYLASLFVGLAVMRTERPFGLRGISPEQRMALNPYSGIAGRPGYGAVNPATGYDDHLRAFMLGVYNYMFLGLGVTGIVAYLTYVLTVTTDPSMAFVFDDDGTLYQVTDTEYLTDLGALLWGTPLSYVVCFGPLAIILFNTPTKLVLGSRVSLESSCTVHSSLCHSTRNTRHCCSDTLCCLNTVR